MDTRKSGIDESIRFHPESVEALETRMKNAATYEQLMSCWVALKTKLDSSFADQVKEYGTLGYWLNNVYSCFARPPYACDTGVKNISENKDLLKQLGEFGVPEEFLLHTVRMGAVKGMEVGLEKNPSQPVELYSDGTMLRMITREIRDGEILNDPEAERERLIGVVKRLLYAPNIDGYSWANERLKNLVKEKRDLGEKGRKEETEKEKAIARIQKSMHEPGFHLTKEDSVLLRQDFEQKLRFWKAVLEGGVGGALEPFLQIYGDDELTSEIFERLKKVCDTDPAIKKALSHYSLPLEIVNPDSGWFSVLIINKKTTLKEFFSSAYSNMDGWFQL